MNPVRDRRHDARKPRLIDKLGRHDRRNGAQTCKSAAILGMAILVHGPGHIVLIRRVPVRMHYAIGVNVRCGKCAAFTACGAITQCQSRRRDKEAETIERDQHASRPNPEAFADAPQHGESPRTDLQRVNTMLMAGFNSSGADN